MDNFGDHRNTGGVRVDATYRAPFDMGLGSNKKRYVECPGCGKVLCCRETCRGIECSKCKKRFDPSEQENLNEKGFLFKETKKPFNTRIVSDSFRKLKAHTEKKAEDYINKRKR